MSTETDTLRYQDAGVDIEQADRWVSQLQHKDHRDAQLLSGIGGFAALYELPSGLNAPVLVPSTDGVGTKLKLASMMDKHDTIGIDLVAMCVNDVLTQLAKPLFFLDYYATGKLSLTQANAILNGIRAGCEQANMPLVGGETAEMPACYAENAYDLAGFCVGVVEKAAIPDPTTLQAGTALIAVSSSGLHSNGFSLIHHLLDNDKISLEETWSSDSQETLGETLLTPTMIYADLIAHLIAHCPPLAIAHITGGGITGNCARITPPHCQAQLDTPEWPDIFHYLAEKGGINTTEMHSTFNCGVGLVIAVSPQHSQQTVELCQTMGFQSWQIGQLAAASADEPRVTWVQQ